MDMDGKLYRGNELPDFGNFGRLEQPFSASFS
jgi:hypothetical protein